MFRSSKVSKTIKSLKLFSFSFLSFFILATFISVEKSFADSDFYLKQYPESVKENEEVYYTLKSDAYNLSESNILWRVDGVKSDEGLGRSTFKAITPKQNKQKIITVEMDIAGGEKKYTSVVLQASPYFLMYEGADSYTPAFYKGRALPAKEGITRIGVVSFEKSFTPLFSIGGSVQKNTDKKVILIKNKITDTSLDVQADIYKEASLIDRTSKQIKMQKPELILYSTSLSSGPKREVLGSEEGNEFYIEVEPFFFSTTKRDSSLMKYVWYFGNERKETKTPWFVKLSSANPEKLEVRVEANQSEKITQNSQKLFNVNFK